jgi:hypothetical protein
VVHVLHLLSLLFSEGHFVSFLWLDVNAILDLTIAAVLSNEYCRFSQLGKQQQQQQQQLERRILPKNCLADVPRTIPAQQIFSRSNLAPQTILLRWTEN